MTLNTYDDFARPDLDAELWQPLNMGGPRLEPAATTTISDGVITVDIPKFTNSDTERQGLDNSKHVLLSTRGFDLSAEGPTRFQVDLAVDHIGGDSGDYRRGVAAFILIDLEGASGLVYNVLATADRIYAEHEILPMPSVEKPFTRVIESPFVPIQEEGFRKCVVEIDRSAGRVTWTVDGKIVHEATGLEKLPKSVHIGFGYFTLVPVSSGKGSNHGQGARAAWRNFLYQT